MPSSPLHDGDGSPPIQLDTSALFDVSGQFNHGATTLGEIVPALHTSFQQIKDTASQLPSSQGFCAQVETFHTTLTQILERLTTWVNIIGHAQGSIAFHHSEVESSATAADSSDGAQPHSHSHNAPSPS